MAADVTMKSTVAVEGITLDGNGQTITVENAADTSENRGVVAASGTIQNVTVTGETNEAGYGFRAVYATAPTGEIIVENCELKGTYFININAGTAEAKLTVRNSKLHNWGSWVVPATFTDCDFFVGTGDPSFNGCRAYKDTVFTNCDFADGFTFDSEDAATIEFVNCTYNGVAITTAIVEAALEEASEISLVTITP